MNVHFDFIQGADTIRGGSGHDDIYGGHHVRFGDDTGDDLSGGDDNDVMLGDNGEIIRQLVSEDINRYPWVNSRIWKTYPTPFANDRIRNIRRYDDIDFIQVSCVKVRHGKM